MTESHLLKKMEQGKIYNGGDPGLMLGSFKCNVTLSTLEGYNRNP